MISQKIKEKALALGYTTCGIIKSVAFDEYVQRVNERIDAFPESWEQYEYFRDHAKPQENGNSIIVCTRGFTKYKTAKSLEGFVGKVYMFDNRVPYTQEHRDKLEFEDYLKILGMKIIKGYVPARWAAAEAGIGKFGYNNFIYDTENGSNLWIDTWIVDTELEYDTAPENKLMSACSDKCGKCIEACPTNAMKGKLSMDMGRCITSVQTNKHRIQKEDIRSQMSTWIYGCDACQDACPVNKNKNTKTEDFPLLSEHESYLQLENILTMDEDTYLNVVNPRFWYAGEEGLWMWKYNALRSMINTGDSKYHALIKQHCDNKDDRLKEIAKWGCDKLGI